MPRRRPFKRTERLNKQIKQVLAVAVQRETREDSLRQVMITDVEVTNDLSLARVFYYPMGGDAQAISKAFERAGGFLRRRVGEEIRARTTPELRFIFDNSIDHGRRVEGILAGLDLSTPPPQDGEEG